MLDSKAYKEYYTVASGAKPPKAKTKYKKTDESNTSPKSKTTSTFKGTRLKSKAKSKVLDEQVQKNSGTNEGTSTIRGVPDVPPYESESDKESWGDSEDEDDNDDDGDDDAENQTEYDEEDVDEGVYTPSNNEFIDEENLDEKVTMDDEEDDEGFKERYKDVNVNLEKGNAEMIDNNQGGLKQHNVSQESGFEGRDDQHKDEDPFARSDRGTKRRKYSKDVESSKDSRSKEKKSSSTSKEASQSQHKTSSNSAHVEEPSHTIKESGMQQHQEFVTRDNDEQHVGKEVTKADCNLTSSKDVYSRRRIIAVTILTIMKKYDYGHLEEIEVRRDDQQLYKFKECDFKRLCLQDIKDIRVVIQKLVENIQLGVESYQKKLNVTKPDTYRSNHKNKTAYTSHSDHHGIIYVDLFRRKRFMHTDELHKFSDGTLNDVQSALYDIAAGIRIEYLPTRKWSNLDKKRAQRKKRKRSLRAQEQRPSWYVRYVLWKPSQDSTRPLGPPSGLKGLLHTLNAIVIPNKDFNQVARKHSKPVYSNAIQDDEDISDGGCCSRK
nr:hypothetical protein [Tanacetum cinerariifolium]